MAIPKYQIWYTLLLLASFEAQILCTIYKVGDLDAWGIPSSTNPQLYTKWSKFHNLTIGDSLFFLYPPSQDSLIQVTKESYDKCNLKDPILYMNNGNSLFNITRGGDFFFTSGVDGRCTKSQKLHVFVYGNGSFADSPASAPTPSYPTVFGSIPVQSSNSTSPSSSSSSSSPLLEIPVMISAMAAVFVSMVVV